MADAGAVTGGARALAVVKQAQVRFSGMEPGQRRWLMLGAGTVVLVSLLTLWWTGRPDWRVLFSGLEARDISQVEQELAAAGIPYQGTADGTGVEVPVESVDKARMDVAAKGMPQTGRLGFELFDKPNWVGSEFDEKVNYQRALEGELEHTIGTLGAVRSARVHLVLPQETLFAGEAKAAKASVVLKLKRASLGTAEADGIRNLVAGAVESLTPEQVTLVDADGRANLQKPGAAGEGDVEQAMEGKLVSMLEPLAGPGNVRATVHVSYDESAEDRLDEVYDPAGSVPLSMQKSAQMTGGGAARAGGIPGTASNTPAAAAPGALQGSATAAAPGVPPLLQASGKDALPVWPSGTGGPQTKTEETGTYAVSKHTTHTATDAGRVKRVTAAVVVNDREVIEGAGKLMHAVWKPRSAEEMRRLEGLAQAAVGFDGKRGDQVVMENVSFSSNQPEVEPVGLERVTGQVKGMLASQPGLLRTAMVGIVGMVLVWAVLRPAVRAMVQPMRMEAAQVTQVATVENAALPASVEAATIEEPVPQKVAKSPMRDEARRLRGHGVGVFDQVNEHIRRDPQQSTRLLEMWIGDDAEAQG